MASKSQINVNLDEITKLTTLKLELESKIFTIDVEYNAVRDVNTKLAQNLADKKEILDTKQEELWESKINLCDLVVKHHEEYGIGGRYWQETMVTLDDPNFPLLAKKRAQLNEINTKKQQLQETVKNMKIKKKDLQAQLAECQLQLAECFKLRQKVLEEPSGPEFTKLRTEIQIQREKCTHLEQLLKEKKINMSRSLNTQNLMMFQTYEKTTMVFKKQN